MWEWVHFAVVYLRGRRSDRLKSLRCIGRSVYTSAVGRRDAAHTSLLHTIPPSPYEMSNTGLTDTPSVLRWYTAGPVHFMNNNIFKVSKGRRGANGGARWLMNYSSGKGGKNEKLSNGGFFPQTCREGQRTDGHFGPRTVNHRVQKQYDFLLNLFFFFFKWFVVSIKGDFLRMKLLVTA